MPFNTKEKQQEYNKKYYKSKKALTRIEKSESSPSPSDGETPVSRKTRMDYIFNFYSTLKTEYDFMIWVRNIRRINKHLFSEKAIQKKSDSEEKINEDDITKYIDCIKSFLKVGERYFSLLPSKTYGVPIFFTIKEIASDKIIITYVDIRFIKYGTGEAEFVPEWDKPVREITIDEKHLHNIRTYSEKENYKYHNYVEIRKDVIDFYRGVH